MVSTNGERSPKRKRAGSFPSGSTKRQRTGSFSSTSPPLLFANQADFFVRPPQTPPSSFRMSPSFQSQSLPGSGMNFPTPPSTAECQGQSTASGGSSEGGTGPQSGHPTPVEEERKDGDGDTEVKSESKKRRGELAEIPTTGTGEYNQTGHDRHLTGGSHSASCGANVVYKLATEPIPISEPRPEQNLLDLYSLTRVQASVARRDPITGEKINKLRKSYEGKLKDLGLEGRNKAVKDPEDTLAKLVDPMLDNVVDGDTWFTKDRLIDRGLDFSLEGMEQTLGLLDTALGGLKPGKLPLGEHEQWKGLLGLDDVKPASAPAIHQPAKPTAGRLPVNSVLASGLRSSVPASPKSAALRPERAGKKRRYDESSYTGYAEGYDDDGYATGEGSRRGSTSNKRQKRKDVPNATSPTASSPTFASAGGGSMVGVRSS